MSTKSQNRLNIEKMCSTANVSRSGYYAWLRQKEKRVERELQDKKDFDNIVKAYSFKNRNKGAKSIKMVLFRQFNIFMNLKKIRRLMKKFSLACPIRKANPYKRIGKALKSHVVRNALNREFDQGIPGKVLLTDITYIYYGMGNRAFLSTIKDGCTKQIPAYSFAEHMKTELITNTLQNLWQNPMYRVQKEALFHSDQGIQYTSFELKEELKSQNLIQSMSRRGNCWDNSPQESFFGHMKDELHLEHCNTFEQLKEEIDSYMEYYNQFRYQWGLEQMAPNEYYNYKMTGVLPY